MMPWRGAILISSFTEQRDIIVVGTSTGGVESLIRLARALPAGLPAAVLVVVHFPAYGAGILPALLSNDSALPAANARDGEPIEHGRIYLAPPDHHLLVEDEHTRLSRGPRENRARPAIDVLFRTAAAVFGRRVAGVLLSGTLDDGPAGLAAVKGGGGVAIVQDPDEALFPGMSRNALGSVPVDHVLHVEEMAPLLARLASPESAALGYAA